MKKSKRLSLITLLSMLLIFSIELIIYLHIFKSKDLLNILPALYIIAAISIISFCFIIYSKYDQLLKARCAYKYDYKMLFVWVLSIVPVIFVVYPGLVALPKAITNSLSAGHFWLIVLAACQLMIITPTLHQAIKIIGLLKNNYEDVDVKHDPVLKKHKFIQYMLMFKILFLVLSFDITLLQFSHINKIDRFSQAIKHKFTLILVSFIALMLFGLTCKHYAAPGLQDPKADSNNPNAASDSENSKADSNNPNAASDSENSKADSNNPNAASDPQDPKAGFNNSTGSTSSMVASDFEDEDSDSCSGYSSEDWQNFHGF